MAKKDKEVEFNILEELTRGIEEITDEDSADIGIMDFINDKMKDSYGMTPLMGNRVILKAFYNEPLDSEEQAILDRWVAEGKTNWKHPSTFIDEVNRRRILEGKEPWTPEQFQWRELILEAGMRSSKSTVAKTLVSTTSGLLRFDEILPQVSGDEDEIHDVPEGMMFDTLVGPKDVYQGISETPRKTLKLRTRFGFEVEGSLNHPMLVMTEHGILAWKELQELELGDYMIVKRARKTEGMFGDDSQTGINPEVARILGYLVGDGCVTRSCEYGASLTSCDSSLIEDYAQTLLDQFGVKVNRYLRIEKSGTCEITFTNRKVREQLYELGLDYVDAYGKSVPKAVRMGSKETVRQFLRGLFDTDGCASNSGNRVSVSFSSVSHELVRQVQALLLQFGIVSSVKYRQGNYVKKNGSLSFSYQLHIYGADAKRFLEEIGFGLERKQALYAFCKDVNNTTVDKIPHLHKLLREMKDLEGYTPRGSGRHELWNKIRKQCTNQTRRNTDTPGGISYDLLDRVIEYFEPVKGAEVGVKYLKSLRDADFFYDPVVEITEGEDYLYDVEVPDGQNFIANGLVSHNTQMAMFIILYTAYKLMTTPREKWAEKFGFNIPLGTPVYITCLAATQDSTERTVYGQVKSFMENTKVFKQLIEQGRLAITEGDIRFPENSFYIVAGNSRAAGQVGRLAACLAMDEIAFLANEQGKSNAGDLWDRLGRSVTNLGDFAKKVAISSVKEEGDFMQELQENSWDKQHLGSLCFRLSTWEINETLSIHHPEIAKAYEVDPVTAARDYENIRPAAEDAFLNAHLVDMAVSHDYNKYVQFSREHREVERLNENGILEKRTFVTLENVVTPKLPVGMFSVAHCDPGVTKDSFALAIGHAESTPDGIATVIDFVLDWVPLRGPDGKPWKVDFPNVEDVILYIAKQRNLMRLTFDHWQGETSIQRLWRAGIAAREDNFSGPRQLEGYKTLRDRINAGLVKIPNYPVLIEELKQLVLKNNSRVDHPKKMSMVTKRPLSKDIADCVMAVDSYIASAGAAFARTPQQEKGLILPSATIQTVGQNRTSQINWDFK